MEIISTDSARKPNNLVAGVHNPAQTSQREARAIGEELTSQGRLRMDAFQTERRLKSAYSNLGEMVYKDLRDLRNVDLNNGRVIELLAHIRYYQDELARLHSEVHAHDELN